MTLSFVTAVACILLLGAVPVAEDQAGQGVTGAVRKLSGNHMPGPGAPRGEVTPLAVPVHVFKGAVQPFKTKPKEHKSYVTSAKSGADGVYRIALPPGTYTVVAEIDGELYLNLMQGDGSWATIDVVPDQWTTWNIDDTRDAAF